jgi:hypothetical protein
MTAKLILTGKETYDSEYPTVSKYDALEAMIEFAKYHVEEALNKVGDVVNPEIGKYSLTDKEQILKAYPLDLIK